MMKILQLGGAFHQSFFIDELTLNNYHVECLDNINLNPGHNYAKLSHNISIIDIENIKHNSLKKINSIISENKKIIGYGAPAKATTVLNYFGINSDHFEYIVDDNHLKHNLYVPETGIKIIESDTINPDDYDFVLVLAWNFFDSIKKQQKTRVLSVKNFGF